MPQVEPERCPTCFKSLSYRDNDNPLLNCVALCENPDCSDPFREEYYEEPAGAEEFRKTEEWRDCMMEVFRAYGNLWDEDKTPKLADALYITRTERMVE